MDSGNNDLSKWFYTSTASGWLKVREVALYQSNGFCARCKKYFSDTSMLKAHHKQHLKGKDYLNPNKSLNLDNIEVICQDCHNKEHDRFKNVRNVYIVYGPPLAGKNTFVKKVKEQDDIVVDMDAIYKAITLNDLYDKPESIKYNAFAIRSMLLDHIKTKYGYWRNAWIIGGYSNSFERERVAKELNAECILVEATAEECIKRLRECKDHRQLKYVEWEKYILDWFKEYTPPSKN